MNKIWILIGRAAFWLAWPLLYLYFYPTRRTRVLVIAGDETLLVKQWLASEHWSLPGGGLRWHEDPRAGAIRELQEETGVRAGPEDLRELSSGHIVNRDGHRFYEHVFLLELPDKPQTTRRMLEITDIKWAKWKELAKTQDTDKDLRRVLAIWQSKV